MRELSPRAVVEELFDRMADEKRRREIDELFADTAVITVPGNRFEGSNAPGAMLDWLAPRYERVGKEFDRWIETDTHVVSLGTLYGVDNDGEEFDGVRYVDVYRVEEGLIQRMDVYNDLAVEGVVDS